MVEHFFAPETSPERLFVMLITNLTSSFKILVGFSGGGGGESVVVTPTALLTNTYRNQSKFKNRLSDSSLEQ